MDYGRCAAVAHFKGVAPNSTEISDFVRNEYGKERRRISIYPPGQLHEHTNEGTIHVICV